MSTHVQTIVSGDISRYYYRDCSCGWQGPPRYHTGEAMEDECPTAKLTRPSCSCVTDPEAHGTCQVCGRTDKERP